MTARIRPIVTGIILSILLVPTVASSSYAVHLDNPGEDEELE